MVLNEINVDQLKQLKWNPFEAVFHRYSNQTLLNEEDNNKKIYLKLKELGVPLDTQYSYGGTLLHNAIYTGDVEILEDILKAGVDVNAKIQSEYTAMFYAGLHFGAGPGREAQPILKEIEKLFKKYGYIEIEY